MSTKQKIRLAGLACGLMGNGAMFASWREAHDHGKVDVKAAFIGPCCVALGLVLMIEASPESMTRPSVLARSLILAGGVLGFLYAMWLKGGG
jgi:hypothetical protein